MNYSQTSVNPTWVNRVFFLNEEQQTRELRRQRRTSSLWSNAVKLSSWSGGANASYLEPLQLRRSA